MRSLLIISFLLLLQPVKAQDEIELLSREITHGCKTDKEKVTKIFRWITDNISYRTQYDRMKVIGSASKKFAQTEFDTDTGALKPLNVRVSETVLRNRVAVCDGYSRLFATLCEYAGIRSEVIIGYARGSIHRPDLKFSVNHYWNAVFFDNKWQLLDATWASGYITRQTGEFVREYDPHYFLTRPEDFIRDHYPDDQRWTLLTDDAVPDEFKHSPFKQKSFLKYRITSFLPSGGVIEASVGDVIQLELVTADPEKDKKISPDMLLDSAIFTQSASWIFLDPLEKEITPVFPHKYNYSFRVESPDVEWLYLKYNNDLVLRYKINIRNRKLN